MDEKRGACGKEEKRIGDFIWKPEGKIPFGRLKSAREVAHWINISQDRGKCGAVMTTVTNFQIARVVKNILTGREVFCFLQRALLHAGVSDRGLCCIQVFLIEDSAACRCF